MTERTMSGSEALVEGLVAAGATHVFGLPGDTGVDLYDALEARSDAIRHVLARDERHAATMADTYARSRNQVGVVEVSSGGGASYCVGGLGEPYAASVPMLVVSSDIHAGSRGTGALTELDQEQLFSAVTKWCRRAERPQDIPDLLTEALASATSGRPAPVALIIPEDVLAERAPVSLSHIGAAGVPAERPHPGAVGIPAERPRPADGEVADLARSLLAADRPAVVAGGGVHSSAAYEELAALADAAALPVATTIHGKGAYPESAPWSLGVAGANGARPYANAYLASADVVLFVGARANATDTNSFTSPPRSATVFQIDIDPERAGRNYPGATGIAADAAAALSALLAEIGARGGGRPDLRRDLQAQRTRWEREQQRTSPDGTVHPLEVLDTIRDAFGAHALIVADCGTPTPFLAAHWRTESAGRRLLVARGHGPMGYGIPGAVGAALANPEDHVVCLTTDGSLPMACGELETLVRLGLPVTVVQLTNGSYGWIKMLQHLYHDRRYFGIELDPVDAAAIARGFGVESTRVDSAPGLRDALKEAAAQPGPRFVEVFVPDEIETPPPVAPWTAALSGEDTTRPVY